MEEKAKQTHPLNVGDSLGLISIILGVFAFAVSPPPLLKFVLLLGTIFGIAAFIWLSQWTHSLPLAAKILFFVFISWVILYLGLSQLNDQTHVFNLIHLKLLSVVVLFSSTRGSKLLYFLFGVSASFFVQVFVSQLRRLRACRRVALTSNKGFLDYKLQADKALNRLGPELQAISKVIAQVGSSVASSSKRVKAAQSASTQVQMRVINASARMLNRHSKRLDSKVTRLERTAQSLTEGLTGWLTWMRQQPDGLQTAGPLVEMLKAFLANLRAIIPQSDSYLESVSGMLGVSQDLNVAVELHLELFQRVRSATVTIADSCEAIISQFELPAQTVV